MTALVVGIRVNWVDRVDWVMRLGVNNGVNGDDVVRVDGMVRDRVGSVVGGR